MGVMGGNFLNYELWILNWWGEQWLIIRAINFVKLWKFAKVCGVIILLKTFRTASFYIEPKLIDIGEANQKYAVPAGASL